MFRANMSGSFLVGNGNTSVDQLLDARVVCKTGYFDPAGVEFARRIQSQKPRWSLQRFSLDMGLMGVISTQLWHHLYLGGGLADIPAWAPPRSLQCSAALDIRQLRIVKQTKHGRRPQRSATFRPKATNNGDDRNRTCTPFGNWNLNPRVPNQWVAVRISCRHFKQALPCRSRLKSKLGDTFGDTSKPISRVALGVACPRAANVSRQ